jgi:chromosomal replication initiation ATPase DnaA
MARAWAEAAAAAWLRPDEGAQAAFARGEGRVVIDDADSQTDPGKLAFLLDAAKAEGGAVLLTAAEPPETWAGAADLLSRLKALPSQTLPEPDDRLLEALLMRLAKARFIKLHEKAVTYLVQRMERSYGAAQALTEALDRMHVRGSRPVTVAIAARALRSVQDASDGDASSV